MLKTRVPLAVLVVTWIVTIIIGYPDGAPPTTCISMTPNHSSTPSKELPPYSINVSSSNYSSCGPKITVTLQATGTTIFKGFMLSARPTGGNENISVGTFNSATNVKQICSNQSATHTSGSPKMTISVQWTPPAVSVGTIVFRCTIVQMKSVYWVGLQSKTINASSTWCASSTSTAVTSIPSSQIMKDRGCGTTKGCFSDCSNSTCTFLLSWMSDLSIDRVTFNLTAQVVPQYRPYAAFGLSEDLSMGDDSVTECVLEGINVTVYNSYNQGRKNLRLDQSGLSMLSSAYKDGLLFCSFTRLKAADVTGQRFILAGRTYFIFFATGTAGPSGIYKHDSPPAASPRAVSLEDTSVNVFSTDIPITTRVTTLVRTSDAVSTFMDSLTTTPRFTTPVRTCDAVSIFTDSVTIRHVCFALSVFYFIVVYLREC